MFLSYNVIQTNKRFDTPKWFRQVPHRMKQYNETICVRVSAALKKRMEQVAKAEDRSLGSWIRQQVARQLRRERSARQRLQEVSS